MFGAGVGLRGDVCFQTSRDIENARQTQYMLNACAATRRRPDLDHRGRVHHRRRGRPHQLAPTPAHSRTFFLHPFTMTSRLAHVAAEMAAKRSAKMLVEKGGSFAHAAAVMSKQ